MKIKRFNESEQVDISADRVKEVIDELRELSDLNDSKSEYIDSLITELDNYKNNSKKGNDQIDDSVLALKVIKSDILDILDKLDTVVTNLSDYNDSGRKFLYTDDSK